MTWLRTPQIFVGSGGSKCAQNILHSGQRICQERVPIPKLILASLEVEDLVFHWGIGQTVLYPRSLWYSNLWTLVSAKADNGEVYDRYLIFATPCHPCLAVKALHTFWVVYPPKASLRSDILEARHHVRSFNLLGKLLKKAQKESEPLTRSDLAGKLGLATTKSYGTGDLISKRVVETVLSILSIQQ